jgi:hypothetical protein
MQQPTNEKKDNRKETLAISSRNSFVYVKLDKAIKSMLLVFYLVEEDVALDLV